MDNLHDFSTKPCSFGKGAQVLGMTWALSYRRYKRHASRDIDHEHSRSMMKTSKKPELTPVSIASDLKKLP